MNRNGLAVCLGSVLALFVSGAVLAQSDWLQGAFSPIKHTRDIRPAVGVVVPRVTSRPVIDGILNDEVWRRAATIPKFTHGSTRIRARTGVFLLADEHYLYVAYKCDEREMKKLRAQIKPSKKRDLAVWDDDSVELYVDPTGEGGKHYQFLMNAAGALYYAEGGGRGTEWQATFDAKAHRDKKFWSAEFGIPFNILGLDGALSAILGMPAGALGAVLASLATPQPSRSVLELVREIRIAGGEVIYDREMRLLRLKSRERS